MSDERFCFFYLAFYEKSKSQYTLYHNHVTTFTIVHFKLIWEERKDA